MISVGKILQYYHCHTILGYAVFNIISIVNIACFLPCILEIDKI